MVQSQQSKHRNNVWDLFKVNHEDTDTNEVIDVFIVNFGQISHIALVFPLLTLNKQMQAEVYRIYLIITDTCIQPISICFNCYDYTELLPLSMCQYPKNSQYGYHKNSFQKKYLVFAKFSSLSYIYLLR